LEHRELSGTAIRVLEKIIILEIVDKAPIVTPCLTRGPGVVPFRWIPCQARDEELRVTIFGHLGICVLKR
jgi:hypothetical protein